MNFATKLDPVSVLLHPSIAGLMASLPAPGTIWSGTERALFLTALEEVFELVYEWRKPETVEGKP